MGLCRHFSHCLDDGFPFYKCLSFASVIRTNSIITVFICQFTSLTKVFDGLSSISSILCRERSDERNYVVG